MAQWPKEEILLETLELKPSLIGQEAELPCNILVDTLDKVFFSSIRDFLQEGHIIWER